MPEVSVIIPVYEVESYLAECLDSVLSQDFTDVEIVTVNDASPDRSLEILRRFEKADPRVRVIDLPENVGLGAARNRGLDAATGKYVLFLDSDDAIVPGAIGQMVDRARATRADVVLFDLTREYEDGTVQPGSGGRFLAEAPERFTALEYPHILHLLQIACNKLIRRDLIDRLKLRFVDGWYEDTPFTYPLLVGAGSLTTLPRALLRYRQRADAITRVMSDRHVEVLGQWDRAMRHVEQVATDPAAVRTQLFPQMIRHCALVLLKHERIPKAAHRSFVHELRRLYRRYLPKEGYRALGRLDRVQHSLIQLGSPALLHLHWKLTSFVRYRIHPRPGEPK
jgi:glycosyltransferase involved in cell wall biosynthesis